MSDIVERLRDENDPWHCPAAAAEIERLQALLHRWLIWNGEGSEHDLADETRRALERK